MHTHTSAFIMYIVSVKSRAFGYLRRPRAGATGPAKCCNYVATVCQMLTCTLFSEVASTPEMIPFIRFQRTRHTFGARQRLSRSATLRRRSSISVVIRIPVISFNCSPVTMIDFDISYEIDLLRRKDECSSWSPLSAVGRYHIKFRIQNGP